MVYVKYFTWTDSVYRMNFTQHPGVCTTVRDKRKSCPVITKDFLTSLFVGEKGGERWVETRDPDETVDSRPSLNDDRQMCVPLV